VANPSLQTRSILRHLANCLWTSSQTASPAGAPPAQGPPLGKSALRVGADAPRIGAPSGQEQGENFDHFSPLWTFRSCQIWLGKSNSCWISLSLQTFFYLLIPLIHLIIWWRVKSHQGSTTVMLMARYTDEWRRIVRLSIYPFEKLAKELKYLVAKSS